MDTWLVPVSGWIVAVITGIFLAVQKWLPQKGSVEHKLIDQLQEQMESVLQEQKHQKSEISDLRDELRGTEYELIEWRMWAAEVIVGVQNGTVPPFKDQPSRTLGRRNGGA